MKKLSAEKTRYLKKEIGKIEFPSLLGCKIDSLKPGFAQLSLKYKKQLTQPYGFLHGGVLISLADTAAAFATRTLIEKNDRLVTLELKMNFLSPAQSDIKALARVIHKGKKTSVIDVEVRDKKNRLCAQALTTYMFID
ncbi:MAG: PaaI family thioesterase [candidate division Zixibacteria bacterium]|nr:PaaI family thioesterase [candidate division Zixibacteria bacterium]